MKTDYSDDHQKKAQWLFRGNCDFKIGATKIADIPDGEPLPEIAFAGRSNVGKSSLLNSLTGRKSLARVSNTPGRTKQLNFFSLRDVLMLVDLPGYGYARASKTEIAGWNRLIPQYLLGRPNLRQICLLIDSRHGIKNTDLQLMEELDDKAVSYRIILTKCDKMPGGSTVEKDIMDLTTKHPAMYPGIIKTSSNNKIGILELQCALLDFCKESL